MRALFYLSLFFFTGIIFLRIRNERRMKDKEDHDDQADETEE